MYPKQVILVRKDLKMRKGKLAAQVAHASMGVILEMFKNHDIVAGKDKLYCDSGATHEWLNGSFTKICLAVDDLDELTYYRDLADDSAIPNYTITDNGKTCFNNQPTITCCAIGPDWDFEIDSITEHLKLL